MRLEVLKDIHALLSSHPFIILLKMEERIGPEFHVFCYIKIQEDNIQMLEFIQLDFVT